MNEATLIKMDCYLCGGGIEYPEHGTGQMVFCPHCGKKIELGGKKQESTQSNDGDYFTNMQPLLKLCFILSGVLFLIGLVFTNPGILETKLNKALTLAEKLLIDQRVTYTKAYELYKSGDCLKSYVTQCLNDVENTSEDIERFKVSIKEQALSRHFKMCIFFAGSAVFFIAGVIKSNK